MSASPATETTPAPASLEGHQVPPERLAVITPLVARLAVAAREVSDDLSFSADAADFVQVLEEPRT